MSATTAANLLLWTARLARNDKTALPGLEAWVARTVQRRPTPPGAGEAAVPEVTLDELRDGALAQHPGNQPVVIRGALRGSEAARTWTLDWFRETFATHPIHFGDWETDQENKRRVMASKIPLADAIDGLRRDRAKALRSCTDILYNHPWLLEQLGVGDLERHFGKGPVRADLWLAGPGNLTPFHAAGGGNLFCMVSGEKRWTLVSPEQSDLMYAQVGHDDHLLYVFAGLPGTAAPELGSLGERFPLFDRVRYLVTHLRAGDVLYNPPWWWHQVENLTETVAAAYRFQPRRWRLDLITAFWYTLSFGTRPRFLVQLARGEPMSDDAAHLGDYRLSRQVSQPTSG